MATKKEGIKVRKKVTDNSVAIIGGVEKMPTGSWHSNNIFQYEVNKDGIKFGERFEE